jgi:hypothetical protein
MYFFGIIGYHIPGADADIHPQSAHERFPLPFFEARFTRQGARVVGVSQAVPLSDVG